MTRPRHWLAVALASGGGVGFSPRAPGTAGSALALLLGWPLLAGPAWLPPAACLAAALGGIWATARSGATGDPGWVVIDEVAGQWIALLGLSHVGWPGFVAAFALFRLFDITKPGPIGWADRHAGAAWVMADDLLAGAAAALLLLTARALWPGLGI